MKIPFVLLFILVTATLGKSAPAQQVPAANSTQQGPQFPDLTDKEARPFKDYPDPVLRVSHPEAVLPELKSCRTSTLPRVICQINPEYSDEARKAKHSENIELGFIVGTDGTVQRIWPIAYVDYSLAKNAVAAVRRWRFQPATCDGAPKAVQVKIKTQFNVFASPRLSDEQMQEQYKKTKQTLNLPDIPQSKKPK